MRHVELRPEFPDAARDQIRVAVELVHGLERREVRAVLAGKRLEIEHHPARQRREDLSHGVAVGRGEAPEPGDRLRQPFEELRFRARRLVRAAGGAHGAHVVRCVTERRAERLEVREPRRPCKDPRVGDGIRGTREQVREADGLAKTVGKDGEREIEAAADPAQQPAEKVAARGASRSRSGGAAGQASLSPS